MGIASNGSFVVVLNNSKWQQIVEMCDSFLLGNTTASRCKIRQLSEYNSGVVDRIRAFSAVFEHILAVFDRFQVILSVFSNFLAFFRTFQAYFSIF